MRKLGLLLAAVTCGALLGCTSGGPAEPAGTAPRESAAPAATEADGVRLTGLSVAGDAGQTVVQLRAQTPISIYSSYNPEPTLVIVDVPNGTFDPAIAEGLGSDPRVRSVKVTHLTEFGRPFARLEVRTADGIQSTVDRAGSDLAVRLAGQATNVPAPAETVAAAAPAVTPAVESEPLAPAPAPVSPAKSAAAAEEAAFAEPAPTSTSSEPAVAGKADTEPEISREVVGHPSKLAHRLSAVRLDQSADGTAIRFVGDGGFQLNDFYLANPSRLVFDLDGVTNGVSAKTLEVGQGGVGRVRISQFQKSPKPVCRVVVDLDHRLSYRIENGKDGARILFSPAAPVAVARKQSTPPAPAPVTEKAPAPTAETMAAAAPEKASVEPAPAEKVAEVATPAEPEHVAAAKAADPIPAPRHEPAKSEKAHRSTAAESALFEAADAALADSKKPEVSGGKFEPKNLAPPEQNYVGEPISLHLKDNDIRDVLRTISNLTGLNIVLDPDVQGKVTIDLEEVPWDQALELILKVNGLNYQLDGNVMRIGPTAKLRTEEKERRQLLEEKELSQAPESYIMTLSYAKADIVMPLVQRVLSKRGDAFVDQRTNKIIIKDLKDYIQRAIALVEKLDIPADQVVIEARIVETTKNFSRELGVSWGFLGQADAAHGNATGWQFPYDGTIAGGVGLGVPSVGPGGGPLLSMTLGSILDTFNLDAALSAAEAEGLAKIVSAPKVTTETNFTAQIQSGVQLPVQTTANNTTTVSYLDATLSLNVRPQITAQGTIIMDVLVRKAAPLPGLVVAGGQNVPLSTREARTRLMVKDGGTAVIGGIYEITDNDAESRVPGLGSLPIIGNLFKNSAKQKKHDELLIFITPRILKG